MPKRSKLEMLADIISVIQKKNGKAKPTHILYGANLSYTTMKECLSLLLQKNLIKKVKEGNRTYYVATRKGYEFLNEFRRLKKFTEAFGVSFD